MTHEQEEAFELGDRVAVLNAGRLEQIGTPEELFEKPETRFVATFIGRSSVVPVIWESSGARLPHGPVWPAIAGRSGRRRIRRRSRRTPGSARVHRAAAVRRPPGRGRRAPLRRPCRVLPRRDRSRRRDRGPRAAAAARDGDRGARRPRARRPRAAGVSACGDGVRPTRGRLLLAAALAVSPLLARRLSAPRSRFSKRLGAPRFTLAHFAEFARRPAEWQALWASLWISLATVILAGRDRRAPRLPLRARRVSGPAGPGRPRRAARWRCRRSSASSPFSSSTARAASRRAPSRRVLRLERPPWRLSGPAAILLVHAYSMYVYFYLFTRAGLARLDAAYARGRRASARRGGARRFPVTLPLLAPGPRGRGAPHLHDVARPRSRRPTFSAAASG